MSHIAFITGPADFLTFYSYVKHHNMEGETMAIVLFGTKHNISEELKLATRRLTGLLNNASYYFQDSDEGVDGLSSLRQEIGFTGKSPTNLFITHVFGAYENLALDTFVYDRLILIENGLATYYPPMGRDPRLKQDYYATRPRKHVHEAWLPLAQFIGHPFYLSRDVVQSPSAQDFRSSTVDLLTKSGLTPTSENVCKKVMFVAGTSLYRLGVISQEREIKCYQQFVEKIVETDVDRIYWKPHPRMSINSDAVSSISTKVTTLTDPIPLEFHFLQKKSEHATCASIASSALLFGQHIYDVKPILLSQNFKEEIRFPHLTNLKYLVNSID